MHLVLFGAPRKEEEGEGWVILLARIQLETDKLLHSLSRIDACVSCLNKIPKMPT